VPLAPEQQTAVGLLSPIGGVAERVARNGEVSFWYAAEGLPEPRAALPGDLQADVCIVGGGFTGLWTAYYLKRARPELQVVVLEREFAGFGASGRNGGWLNDEFAAPHGRLGSEAELQRHIRATIDEVLDVAAREGIDCDAVRSGMLDVARSPAQLARLRRDLGDREELSAEELNRRVRVAGALGAAFNEHGARVQPARLVRGLAAAVERYGGVIFEATAVREVRPGAAITERGTVRAPNVLVCLEGFTPGLPDRRRRWLPLNSAMFAPEPLSDAVWSQIGWSGAELLGDAAHAYMYAQRTADGRIALGGRGIPYRFGSRTDVRGRTQTQTVAGLVETLHGMFPATKQTGVAHAWCGVLGLARDWCPSVNYDRSTGLGAAGGYVGNGVAASNLAGRTLCDLVLGHQSELTALPWVGHRARNWEPEPLRFLGARLVYGLYRAADRRETRSTSPRTHPLARIATLLAGR